jgi:hypothetical protein
MRAPVTLAQNLVTRQDAVTAGRAVARLAAGHAKTTKTA